MIGWFILGVCLLAALLLFMRWFVGADPKALARIIKWTALGLGGLVIVFLAATGRLAYALPLLAFLPMLLRGRMPFRFPGIGRPPASGQSSDVETEYLAMSLDHDSGEINGRVLRGKHAGHLLAELDLAALLELLAECRADDTQAARLVETYLDRTQSADWRAQAGGGDGQSGADAGGAMTPDEAYEILNLEPGASADEIKEAHRRLMQKIHPDHGGSSYLAAKINQAKEVLLGG